MHCGYACCDVYQALLTLHSTHVYVKFPSSAELLYNHRLHVVTLTTCIPYAVNDDEVHDCQDECTE